MAYVLFVAQVGVDRSIDGLATPLSQLRGEVLVRNNPHSLTPHTQVPFYHEVSAHI